MLERVYSLNLTKETRRDLLGSRRVTGDIDTIKSGQSLGKIVVDGNTSGDAEVGRPGQGQLMVVTKSADGSALVTMNIWSNGI